MTCIAWTAVLLVHHQIGNAAAFNMEQHSATSIAVVVDYLTLTPLGVFQPSAALQLHQT